MGVPQYIKSIMASVTDLILASDVATTAFGAAMPAAYPPLPRPPPARPRAASLRCCAPPGCWRFPGGDVRPSDHADQPSLRWRGSPRRTRANRCKRAPPQSMEPWLIVASFTSTAACLGFIVILWIQVVLATFLWRGAAGMLACARHRPISPPISAQQRQSARRPTAPVLLPRLLALLSLMPLVSGADQSRPVHASPSSVSPTDCPPTCLNTSIPWWYREQCRPCKTVIRSDRESSWTCTPTWPPRRMYVLFSMQRSATQTACYLVNSLPDTQCAAGELLNPEHWRRAMKRPLAGLHPQEALRQAFERDHAGSRAAPCTWGFRIFPEHLWHPELLDWLWETLDAAIILERTNGARVCTNRTVAPPSLCAWLTAV